MSSKLVIALAACTATTVVVVLMLRFGASATTPPNQMTLGPSPESAARAANSDGSVGLATPSPQTDSQLARAAVADSPKEEPQAPVKAPPAEAKESDWAEVYRDYSAEMLIARRDELRSELFTRVQPEAEKLTAAGRVEYLGQANTYKPEPEDFSEIRSVYLPGTGSTEEVRRVTLPREEYPDLYALKYEMEWVQQAAATRQR